MVTVDPLADSAFLSTSDGSGCWTWAGVRLSAEGRIEATQRFADLSWDERRKRLTEQETAWLAAQWHAPRPRKPLRSAVRHRGQRGEGAGRLLRPCARRDARSGETSGRGTAPPPPAGPNGALPPHVRARPIDSEEELRTWLGYPSQVSDFTEVRKHLSAQRIDRGGTALAYAVRHGFFDSGAAWDAWWRSFASLPFPAVLSIGFDPYDADNPRFAACCIVAPRNWRSSRGRALPPLNPYPVPPDRAAQAAVDGYRRALTHYTGRCFSIRVALASAQPLPVTLAESLAGTVSAATGAARAVQAAATELDEVVGEFRALGAPWLPLTYQWGLPGELDGLTDCCIRWWTWQRRPRC